MGLPEWRCGCCGAWNPLPPLERLRERQTVVRCDDCQVRVSRLLLARVLVVQRERQVRECIRLERAGLL